MEESSTKKFQKSKNNAHSDNKRRFNISQLTYQKTLTEAINCIEDYAIFLLDNEGYIQTWNRGAEKIKGYKTDEVIGKHFSIFYPKNAVESNFPSLELDTALHHGKFEDKGWRVRKDGTLFWANVTITSITDSDTQEPIGFCKITRDLSSTNGHEMRIKILEKGINCVKDYAIFMLDPQGYVVTWNEGAERIKGYTKEEIIGKHFSIFYPDDHLDGATHALETALQQGTFQDENWRVRKGGGRFWASVIITAIHNEHGEHIGFCKVTQDLTEQRKSQDRLAQLQREMDFQQFLAQEAEKLRAQQSKFIDRICHEIRNPLNGILGTVQLLQMEIPNILQASQSTFGNMEQRWCNFLQKLEDSIDGIKQCADHQTKIANEVLTTSKLDSCQIKLDSVPTNLKKIIKSIESMFRNACIAKGLDLFVELPSDDFWVIIDPCKIEEVVVNLVSNAVKFTSSGEIIISLKVLEMTNSSVHFQIMVQDTGIGITNDELQNIFKCSLKSSSNYGDYTGAGLGLCICQQITELMGGTISIQSHKGEGSEFTVDLKCPQTQPVHTNTKDHRQKTEDSLKKDFSTKKILIVEDNAINQKILKSMLDHVGIVSESACNGEEAISKVEQMNFNLILMDILMPKMDGIEATKKILQRHSIPIIGVSGFAQEKDKSAALKAGMVDYIIKPYQMEELWRIVSTYLT